MQKIIEKICGKMEAFAAYAFTIAFLLLCLIAYQMLIVSHYLHEYRLRDEQQHDMI